MMNQQAKRFALVTLILHPVDSVISDQVGDITVFLNGIVILCNEVGIIIVALSGHNLPIIEA